MIIREASTITHQLREADLEAELTLAFQPIVDCTTNQTAGFEALARWKSPVLGQIAPDLFIRSAEQMGIVSRITFILLEKAIGTAAGWREDVCLSFNLSAYDLCSHNAISRILEIVERSGFAPDRLTFEITETAVMQDFDRAISSLGRLRAAGISIALDDFGSGYSSLSYLRKLPIDCLKIDRSFVQDIGRDPAGHHVVETIVRLCRSLDLACVVEGVETQAQLDLLRQMGCTRIQGYYFSRPMGAIEAAAFLRTEEPGARAS